MEIQDSPESAYNELVKSVQESPLSPAKSSFLRSLITDINADYSYKNQFPRLNNYESMKTLQLTFPSLSQCNSSKFDPFEYTNYDMILIKTQYSDDLHKSMKYGIWSGTKQQNDKINDLLMKNQEQNRKTLMCFQLCYEQSLVGVAELTTMLNSDLQFGFWQDRNMLFGNFKINWLFVKNIELENVTENCDLLHDFKYMRNLNIIHQRLANSIIRSFHSQKFVLENTLFCFFSIFDQREDQMISSRTISDIKITLQKRQKKIILPRRKSDGLKKKWQKPWNQNQQENYGKKSELYVRKEQIIYQ